MAKWTKEEVKAAIAKPWVVFKEQFPARTYDGYRSKRRSLDQNGLIPEDKQWEAPTYTAYERMEGDVVLCGDLHIPFTDWDFANEVVEVGKFLGVKQLLIGGDLFDFDALKYFMHLSQPIPLPVEKSLANAAVASLRAHYDKIVIIRGNHETRLLRMLGTWTDMEELLKAGPEEGVYFSNYAYCLLETPTGTFRATHPKSYSRVKGSVANQMADKHTDQSIINFHGHFQSQGVSKDGKRACIDCGCMVDPHKIDYLMLEDATYPFWNVSFGALVDGTWLTRSKLPHLDNLGWYMNRD